MKPEKLGNLTPLGGALDGSGTTHRRPSGRPSPIRQTEGKVHRQNNTYMYIYVSTSCEYTSRRLSTRTYGIDVFGLGDGNAKR